MSKTVQQDLSVLSSAKSGLVYLTANDWTLIADKATRVSFKAGDRIIELGRRTHGVYLLLKGTARVEIPSQTVNRAISVGEVCGELSFLDELPATANVLAQGAVEAYYLDRPTLTSLFELFPHLASRFYRSLAANLAKRLRDVIGSKPLAASLPTDKKNEG
jgi:extracellular factor (EF) 3-hydroxypalmitic acid methyl ester biosynthesis protein